MGYLLAQIFFCLLLAFALGVLIGWLLRSLRREEPSPADDRALADARTRVTALEAELAACLDAKPVAPVATHAAPPAAGAAAAASGAAMGLFGAIADKPVDDLKLISGIAEVIETQPAGIGVTTYKQIANFTADDVERVNDAIEVFQGRIEREEWIPQAARLHREKYGTDA